MLRESWIGPDGKVYHSHDGLAPHSHDPIESPGYFSRRAPPLVNRDFKERAFTVGIGGPVGTGYLFFFFSPSIDCFDVLQFLRNFLLRVYLLRF